MAEYGPLVEYLLGVERPSGGKLVRFGATINRIVQFPPNFSVTLTIYPRFGAYVNIQFVTFFSKHVIPGVFWLESRQFGISFQGGFITETVMGIHNMWMELTEANPVVTTITNVTQLLQYYEGGVSYLIIQNEGDYRIVRRLIDEWYTSSRVIQDRLNRTNQLLESLVGIRR